MGPDRLEVLRRSVQFPRHPAREHRLRQRLGRAGVRIRTGGRGSDRHAGERNSGRLAAVEAEPLMAAAATSFAVRTPRWDLWYDGQNIGGRVSPMLVSITYTDHVGHSSNDLEFELEDREKRWQAGWFPTQGNLVRLAIGYDGEELLSCGDFQVDELELEGPPDVMKMR